MKTIFKLQTNKRVFPSVAYNSPGTTTNIIGIVNQHEGDIKTKLLNNLRHKSLGIWNSATPENPDTVENAGTYRFTVVQAVQYGDYNAANRNDAGDLPKIENKVLANVERQSIARTEFEQLDGAIIENVETFTSYIAKSHSESMAALLDAHYIDLLVKTAAADKANREVIIADAADLDTEIKRTDAYRKISRAFTQITRQIDKYNLGSNPADYATFLQQDLMNDLLLSMPKGGDSATGIGEELATLVGAARIAGLGLTKDHLYLGQNIPAGANFHKSDGFDFSKIFGAMAHKEALFIALNGLTVRATVSPNSGNDILITKFNLYKKAVRPELVKVIRTVASV